MEVVRTPEFRKNYSELLRVGYSKDALDDEIGTVVYYLMNGIKIPDS
tara:strand:+ start:340 stop:480 length:141 start_codon:yes stop_codon:yes gene_type:complete